VNDTVTNVQQYLTELGLVDGSTVWPSVKRRLFDEIGDKCVVLTEDGGRAPQLPSDPGTAGDTAIMDPAVQILVRAGPWESDVAMDQARAIMDVLHGKLGIDIGDRYYLRVAAQSSEPIFIGFDGKNRPQFTQSFRFATGVLAEST
jgi:hypothetical protein